VLFLIPSTYEVEKQGKWRSNELQVYTYEVEIVDSGGVVILSN